MKDITKEESQELREMARLAFRNSVGATEDDAVSFNYRDYSTLDLNFLWHFKMLVEAEEREACAKVADGELMNTNMLTSYPPKSSAAWNIAAAIRARGNK